MRGCIGGNSNRSSSSLLKIGRGNMDTVLTVVIAVPLFLMFFLSMLSGVIAPLVMARTVEENGGGES